MKERSLKTISGKSAVILKTDDYLFMQYLIDGKPWFMDIERTKPQGNESLVGNIYKGKVKNTTINGMTFVDVGIGEDVMIGGADFSEGDYVLLQIVADPHDGKTLKGSLKIEFSSSLVFLEASAKKKAVKNPHHLIKHSKELSAERVKELKKCENDVLNMLDTVEEIRGIVWRTNAQNKDNDCVLKNFAETLSRWKNVRKDFATKIGPGLLLEANGKADNFVNNYLPHADVLLTNDLEFCEIAKNVYNITTHLFENADFFDFEAFAEELEVLGEDRVCVNEDVNFKFDFAEACTFVDVNSGGFKKGRDTELTKLKINLIASSEILRQISLRNVGGPIIIDFISLKECDSSVLLEKLVEESKNDRQKTTIFPEITNLGMVEMERKRTFKLTNPKDFEIMFSE